MPTIINSRRTKEDIRSDRSKLTHPEGARDEKGRFVKGSMPKSGFHTNPENISSGNWKKENSLAYQYNRFKNMEMREFRDLCVRYRIAKIPNGKTEKDYPYKKHSACEEMAARRVLSALTSLADVREITNRTEGLPVAHTEVKVDNRIASLTDAQLSEMIKAEFGVSF